MLNLNIPWTHKQYGDNYIIIEDSNGDYIGEVIAEEAPLTQEHFQKAKLLAATPDLLAIVHRFLYDENCIDGNNYQGFVSEAQAAYDKAIK